MNRTMIDPTISHSHDWLWTGIVVVAGWLIALFSSQGFLVFLGIVLTVIKIIHSVILLRRATNAADSDDQN